MLRKSPNSITIPVTPKRRRSCGSSNGELGQVVKNVHKFISELRQHLHSSVHLIDVITKFGLKEIIPKVSELCDVSKSFVTKSLKSQVSQNVSVSVNKSSKKFRKKKYECDSFSLSMIRRLTQDFYAKQTYPTLKLLWQKCRDSPSFPPIGKTVFHQWLTKNCKFKYRKINKKPVFLERTDIVAHREKYMRDIRSYRKSGYNIYYSDETWCSPDQSRNKCWQMLLDDSEKKALEDFWNGHVLQDMNGWTGGFLVKSAKGRVIINHIGNEKGFLDGGDDIFISKVDTKDYHGNMNHERYLDWFRKVLTLVPDKSVLVLDQAPYHKKRVEGTSMPNMSWLKKSIVEWVLSKNIQLPTGVSSFENMSKAALIELSKTKPVKPKYIVEKLAEECEKDIRVLWLPTAHCEFNPIEIVWSLVKGYVSKHNKGDGIQKILELSKEGISKIKSEIWANCVLHAIKYEDRMWERDKLIDVNIDALRSDTNHNTTVNIPVFDNDTTDSEESNGYSSSSDSDESLKEN